jgi:superfamily II DNA or RNA helicase
MSELPTLWPSQELAVQEVKTADADGFREPICVTAPTGGGKTLTMGKLAEWANSRSWQVGLFTNRKLLTKQAGDTLTRIGVGHGFIAAEYQERLLKLTQVCSFQTLASRVLQRETTELPRFRMALIDEAHSNKGSIACEIIRRLRAMGCLIVGFTATPVNIGHIYKKLIVAGTKRELRERGALVPCKVFAPDEPDLKGVKRKKVGEYEYKGQVKRLMQTLVFANVIEQWKKTNPDGKPTLQWAPGVKESRWFEKEWQKAGITCRHIDASTPDNERQDIIGESRDGKVQVITSQGIMREGVDLPWICHGILTQPCNGLSTYLQIVGRLLRACPDTGKTEAVLQDHAGAYWRHGSPNDDRVWNLNETDESIGFERKKKFEQGEAQEPIRCPECGGWRKAGPACPYCGHKHKQSVRMVRMTTGELVAVRGNVHKRKQKRDPDESVWVSTLCAIARGKQPRTIADAANWYRRKHGKPPQQGMKFVPETGSPDWNRLVGEVFPWAAGKKRNDAA